jgi:hypothetical protein
MLRALTRSLLHSATPVDGIHLPSAVDSHQAAPIPPLTARAERPLRARLSAVFLSLGAGGSTLSLALSQLSAKLIALDAMRRG